MTWNASAWAIRNPVPVLLLLVLLTLGGLWALKPLQVQSFPPVVRPLVAISAPWPGASTTQLELAVARPLENAVAGLPGLKHTHTTVQDGAVSVTAEFRSDTAKREALDSVRAAVSRARSELPPDLREPGVALVNLSSAAPVLAYALRSTTRDATALTRLAEHDVRQRLAGLPGVATVSVVGGSHTHLQIDLDPTQLAVHQLPVVEVWRQLREQLAVTPAGQMRSGSDLQAIVATPAVGSLQALGQVEISLPEGRRARLDQLGQVRLGTAPRSSLALVDGQPVVAVQVTRTPGAGDVEVGRAVREAISRLQQDHPDVLISEVLNTVDAVEQNYRGSMALLLEGALLTILVVGLFLRNGRATLIAATALPLSIVPTFAVMHLAGFSLNTVTLLSLSLVIGVVVDDAIVEIENIERHLRMGKSPYQAALDATAEIGMAVIATTLALVAVFLPTAFMSGIASEYFVQFGWTASLAVLCSLLVARLATPALAAYGLRAAAPRPPARDSMLMRGYLASLSWCLAHPVIVGVSALALVAGALAAAARLDTGFLPADDGAHTQVWLELAPGSGLARTERALLEATHQVRQHPAVRRVYGHIGAGGDVASGGDMTDTRIAVLDIELAPRSARAGSTKADIERALADRLQALAGVRVRVGIPGSRDLHTVMLTGHDPQVLETHARQVVREIRALPGLGDVTSSEPGPTPVWLAHAGPARAARAGVSTATLGDTLRLATAGDQQTPLAVLRLGADEWPVVARLGGDAPQSLSTLNALLVPGLGGPVRLGDVAELRQDSVSSRIERFDRQRSLALTIDPGQRSLGEVESALLDLPSLKQLPPGVRLLDTGDTEAMNELFSSFAWALGAGATCLVLLLVLLFRDPLQPFTVLAAAALGLPGALLALWASASVLSMPALIGLLMLAGLTAKNAILVVDVSLIARRTGGLDSTAAVLEACRQRARPIVMTSLAMAAGMVPTALGWGVDPGFRAPLALVVLGGLASSTLLSLLVVPLLVVGLDAVRPSHHVPR